MAATFVNLETAKAVRGIAREESRELSKKYCPEIEEKYQRQLAAYRIMPDEELFTIQEVLVTIPSCDMPGRPQRRVQCEQCGDHVQDSRDVTQEGRILCRACTGQRYYQVL